MSVFIGSIDAKLDVKGRVFVPSAYRRLFSEDCRDRVVLRKDPDMDCLILYPEDIWNKSLCRLQDQLDEWNPEERLLLMQFVSDAEWVDLDSQGRILINKRFLQQIGANSDVVFVGMLDRIAIWNRESYENSKFSSQNFAAKLSTKMTQKML